MNTVCVCLERAAPIKAQYPSSCFDSDQVVHPVASNVRVRKWGGC